jgi:curved DNA-binding protein CbpA
MRQRIQEVQNAKKLAERKDYYKILDLPRDCTKQQAKVSFRKLALVWHPDRFTNDEEREKANKMFQDINEAYDVLTDVEKRARYDRGYVLLLVVSCCLYLIAFFIVRMLINRNNKAFIKGSTHLEVAVSSFTSNSSSSKRQKIASSNVYNKFRITAQ